jgi:hypothetical protein
MILFYDCKVNISWYKLQTCDLPWDSYINPTQGAKPHIVISFQNPFVN